MGRWRRCHKEPELAFEGETLATIQEMIGDLQDKQVCLIGSGDNMAAYALSGLGAVVTSTDISEERLKLAANRAEILGVSIDFVRSDAADPRMRSRFDFRSGLLHKWLLRVDCRSWCGFFREVSRILKPGRHIRFLRHSSVHAPMESAGNALLKWRSRIGTPGPFRESADGSYEFNWTLGGSA